MEPYTSFVSLDLETTGLDPAQDEVLEIGAVRVDKGNFTAEFSQLIEPKSAIPHRITQLTGLTNEGLQGQPSIEEVLPRLGSFLGSSPIVCHNASFDLSFLKSISHENRVWDTLDLSRVLIPWAGNHRLENLLLIFGIKREQTHRALEDARATAQLFLRLLDYLEGTDPRSLKLINDLIGPTQWGLKDLFRDAVRRSLKKGLAERKGVEIGIAPLPNVVGRRAGELEDLPQVGHYFDPSGPLSSLLETYEHREEQLEMAREVAESFQEEALLVCEAGTGIGKSLAYLIPAVLWSAHSRGKVVVSTNTKNLQDQLFYKDIPLLLNCLHFDFKAVLLKGRANYLCLRKWFEVTASPDLHLTPEERIAILPLVLWVETTQSGDLSENRGFHLQQDSSLWGKFKCEPHGCLGVECRLYDSCFVTRVRAEAQDANLVVVNHSLLLSDLTAENKILGPYQRLVIDEAHNLEKAATEHLGLRMNLWRVKSPLDLLYTARPVEKGLIPAVTSKLAGARSEHPSSELLLGELKMIKDLIVDGRKRAGEFFHRLAELASSPYGKLRYWRDHRVLNEVTEETRGLLGSLSEICGALSRAEVCLSELGPNRVKGYKEMKADLQARLQELKEVLNELRILTRAEDISLCYWVKVSDGQPAELYGAPIEVGPLLADSLYPALESALFTSATLRVGLSFDYFLERTGLNLIRRDGIRERAFGSPFDFPNQVLTLLPRYLPSPQREEFPEAVSELLKRIVVGTRRGTLVLLTSHRLLNLLYGDLRDEFERGRISLLAQGLSGSRTKLIEQFREESSSALLGTDSFWEGVDVPGEALEILVISKLPFPVPSEPIVEARSEAIEAGGGDAFRELMVPHTVIRFRQGFGRLIRNKRDRGVVVILDNRMLDREYGQVFLSSLPVEAEICRSLEEVEQRVKDWWS